jgi:N,N-dimethylformamidase
MARHAPAEWSAIHFHEDDLDDACWPQSFEWAVPPGTPAGFYAARLTLEFSAEDESTARAEDYIPFVVSSAPGATGNRVCFLAPTVSYLAYSNQQFSLNYHAKGGELKDDAPEDAQMRRMRLLSMYDVHTDKTGVCYASSRRPLLNLRPGYVMPPSSLAAGYAHQLNADLHLLNWLDGKGVAYDLVTDHELHDSGAAGGLLDPYSVVLSGSHPEYWTSPMLEGLEGYQAGGGRFMYLGGNGLYWITSLDPARPWIIEIRRSGGTQAWGAAAGEAHHSTTGEKGGLWRDRGRPPQRLTGVGFVSQGPPSAQPYRRGPGGGDPRAAWIFEGVAEGALIGDHPSLVFGHGAAGFELDRVDYALGTPPHALTLASSFGHPAGMQLAVEEMGDEPTGARFTAMPVRVVPDAVTGLVSDKIHADLCFFEGPKGGAVFSVGSIAWCGGLTHKSGETTVSRVTENVLRRFMDSRPFVQAGGNKL